MRYRELVQFDPIETIIQLRDADEVEEARDLVRTYVISDRMADQLVNLVLPQIQFLRPHDNKGVLVVGNYGTGKSHLMSVLSAVAEYPELLPLLNHPEVQEAAESIAGRFKVVRTEIGGVTGSLRDILLGDLEEALERWGTPYSFPPADQITNNKDLLVEAVARFRERYPDQGILLVVDELLDYLRTRDERALILDLGFLRELGEVAALTPFRFLGGVQETLFDNPRFAFVAEQLRRVRDRFAQVRIAREDIAYVVSHRLLRKSAEQRAWIEEHLRAFTPLYGRLAERMDEFTSLFPIHPAYVDTFERVYVAEKREVLQTFSRAIDAILDEEVPTHRPGLVSYDHYWGVLRDNPTMRSLPEVGKVIDVSGVLEGRVRNAYTRKHLLDVALRIIHALSVQRLTTSDIRKPLGVTAEELRDGLCLYVRLPEPSAEFLLGQVQVALQEIIRTVSGQFISYNEENGQYYLDIEKVVDIDAKIATRAEMLSDDELNHYFFDALQQLMNLSSTTYVTGYRIWPYEVPWRDHNVTRPGYLFFGAPDDRSTAQPPRDFYLYVLPPYLDRAWHDAELADEVIFNLTGLGQEFRELLLAYAGARAMASESPEYRRRYADKADDHLRLLLRWFRNNLRDHLQIIHQGARRPLGGVLAEARTTASADFGELLDVIGAHLLAPHFEEKYPRYPHFPRLAQPITEAARGTSAMEAIRALAGRGRTNLAESVLEGLQLLDAEGSVRPRRSPYARHYLEILEEKPQGQVVNRGEVIEQVAAGLQPIEKGVAFGLEPEWIVVALLALVYNGEIVLSLDGQKTLDAGNLDRAALRAMEALVDFRFYGSPKTLPLNLWVEIFRGLDLQPGLVRDENTREAAVRQHLQPKVTQELERVARLQARLQQGVQLWNTSLFTDRFRLEVEGGSVVGMEAPEISLASTDFLAHVRGYKAFLEGLSRFNTVGKLRNLRISKGEVDQALEHRSVVERATALLELVDRIQPLTAYLAEAQANLPEEHAWSQRARALREEILTAMRRLGRGEEEVAVPSLIRQLQALKQAYVEAYAQMHRRLVLGPEGDRQRSRLYDDPRLKALDRLARIDLLPQQELAGWKEAATHLPVCPQFYEGAIDETPTCPYCRLRPAQRSVEAPAEAVLRNLDNRLDLLLHQWRQALGDALASETAQRSLNAMTPAERAPIETFVKQGVDAADLPANFVTTAQQALRGIEAVALEADALLAALKEGGMPCTVEALQKRFRGFVEREMRGHDAGSTRLTV
ncbi:MAG: DUF6079 family protein, partial [Anaerolineales bacterium]